jgi:mRNA interferase MazF
VAIESDLFDEHPSVTVLPITSELRDTPLFRVTIQPDDANGLLMPSQVMVDKAQTIAREKIGGTFGRLSNESLLAAKCTRDATRRVKT